MIGAEKRKNCAKGGHLAGALPFLRFAMHKLESPANFASFRHRAAPADGRGALPVTGQRDS